MAHVESTMFHEPSYDGQMLSTTAQVVGHAGLLGTSSESAHTYPSGLHMDVDIPPISGNAVRRMDIDPALQPDSDMSQMNQQSPPSDSQNFTTNPSTQAEALVDPLSSSGSSIQGTNNDPTKVSCDMGMAAEQPESATDAMQITMTTSTDSLASPMSGENSTVATPQRKSRKRKAGESTVTPVRKRYRGKGPTKLRKGKQVVADVPMDVWSMIFSYCPAKFLAKARRVSKSFNQALQYESVWRKNRLQNYGPDLPEPFPGMREDEYANLLEGLGCMNCGAAKTRKTYWAWRKRWCIDCYEKNTIKHDAALGLVGDHHKLLMLCVPYGVIDSWGHYEAAGFYENAVQRQGHGHYKVYGKADITRLLEELEEMMKPDANGATKSDDEVEQWYTDKEAIRDQTMEQSQKVEVWTEKKAREKLSKNAELKKDRDKFFRERVGSLDPPLDPEALEFIHIYKKAIEIAKPPSERAWKALVPKLEHDRAQAEAQLEERRFRALKVERAVQEREEYQAQLRKRADGCPQQRILETLADEVLKEFDESDDPIADSDFALLALREVRRKFYEKAENFTAKTSRAITYRLVLEDAKYVLNKKISPRIDSWGPPRSAPAKLFKCPGCTRTDTNLRYTFQTLICHIRTKHAAHVGDFHYLYREGLLELTNVQWLNIEWPFNLPVLANHHVATGKWDPHDETPYVRYQSPWDGTAVAAFNGRRVSSEGPDHISIVNNIIYAGSMLRDTALDGKFKTSIVVKYAVEKCRAVSGNPTFSSPMEDIIGLPLELIRSGLYDIFDRFRCGVCFWQGGCTARETNKIHSVGTLIQHFQYRHSGTKDWVKDMMKFPDDRELWKVLNQPEMGSALAAFDRLFPRFEGAVPADTDAMNREITSEEQVRSKTTPDQAAPPERNSTTEQQLHAEADTHRGATPEGNSSTSEQSMPQSQPMDTAGPSNAKKSDDEAVGPLSEALDGFFHELADNAQGSTSS
ncbi:MAG: hypothetical protein M1816_003009 [Peltula sp. TS41687]|nr:MAG: hypothetical protein M1816_003009 [Peltula sp. TS41687]